MILVFDLDLSTVMYPVVASSICKALLKYDQYIRDNADGSTLKEINVVCPDRETVIIQMKTFDVFLPKLIHRGVMRLESADKFTLTDEIFPLSSEGKQYSNLRHNGSSLVK